LSNGTADLLKVAERSVDVIWSKDVMEHVSSNELEELLSAQLRVLKPNGVAIHSVDFADHLSGGLVSLYFPTRVWESKWFRTSGFYTNRVSFESFNSMVKAVGFHVHVVDQQMFPRKPFSDRLINANFRAKYRNIEPTRRATLILSPSSL
jgi:predicted SAM-dependent methyltransferase